MENIENEVVDTVFVLVVFEFIAVYVLGVVDVISVGDGSDFMMVDIVGPIVEVLIGMLEVVF